MKVTSISVTCGRKINIGDFNSVHLEIGVTAELDGDDDPAAVRSQLWTEAAASLKEQTSPFIKRRQEQVEEVYSNLPSEVQEQINANPRTD